jgi:hypothetical protein
MPLWRYRVRQRLCFALSPESYEMQFTAAPLATAPSYREHGILLDASDLPQSIERLGHVERTADAEQAANFGGSPPGVVEQLKYLLIEGLIIARPRRWHWDAQSQSAGFVSRP